MKKALEIINRAKEKKSVFLDLSNLKLSEVPKEIFQLKDLVEIDLSNNCISELPIEINSNSRIQELNLSYNCFNFITGIGFQYSTNSNIKKIDLSNNILEGIPKDLFYLSSLETIILRNNPLLKNVPSTVINEGIEAIDLYLNQIQKFNSTFGLFEAKVIFVGQGEVGKTSLIKKITNKEFKLKVGEENTTHGINVFEWNKKIKFAKEAYLDEYLMQGIEHYSAGFYESGEYEFDENGNLIQNAKLNIWDFGGQEIYYSTHQFFLTKRSIYVFVWDARKEEEYNSFEYWFNIINTLSKNSPLIIVLNKSDVRIKHIDEESLVNQFSNIKGFYKTSCLNGKGIKKLRKKILREFKDLPHLGDRLPKTWLRFRRKLKELELNYISYKVFLEDAKKLSITENAVTQLSDYFHDLGDILLYKEDEVLKNIVILNPEWVTKAVYRLIDDQKIQKNEGKFSFDDLARVWDSSLYPSDKYFELVRLMEKFELCFNLTGSYNYLIPELLKHNKNLDGEKIRNESELGFEYSFTFLPAGIIPRFICKSSFLIRKGMFWRSGTILDFENSSALVQVNSLVKKISIFLIGNDKNELLAIIRNYFEEIFKSLNLEKSKHFFEMVPCKCTQCTTSEKPYFFKFDTIKSFKKKGKKSITCHNSAEDIELPMLLKVYEKSSTHKNILENITIACSQLQGYHKIIDHSEDSRNSFIANVLLNRGINVKDQTRWGISNVGKRQGELDIKIENKNGLTTNIFEGFNLSYDNSNKITLHLNKIFTYDPNGLENNFIVIYAESKNYIKLWEKYKKRASSITYKFDLVGDIVDLSEKYSYGNEIKIGKTVHLRNQDKCFLHHLFVNMNFD